MVFIEYMLKLTMNQSFTMRHIAQNTLVFWHRHFTR